ncbi:MAG TPA: methyl-accepting chemotaxis protein [Gemmataceae bacterium]|nr:methyl-accepting chemotaxis protein [Gemmataceae bacterium]
MFGLSARSIRFKLYSLVPATLLVVALALGLGLYVQARYAIGGTVYEQMAVQKEFLSDVTPAVMLSTVPVITLQMAETEMNPAELAHLIDQFRAQEREYRETRDKWLKLLPEGDAKRMIERDLHPLAEDLYRVANNEYLPLLVRNQKGDRENASKILREKIMPRFKEMKALGEKLSELTRKQVADEQARAAEQVQFWSRTNLIVSIIAVLLLVGMKWLVARSIVNSTDVLNARMQQLASGASDLTARVEVNSDDELGQLAASINALIGKIQAIVVKVREASLQLLSVASEIAATARQQEQTVQSLSASTTEVAASVREISATSKDLSGTMNEVNQSAHHASDLATKGRDNTTRMAGEMKHLVESTASVSAKLGMIREKADSINAVVTTITKVADQTNLLSINAAIEAEKAGEYGRGFLVVAREIRRLADQTAVATLDIENMVKQMQDAVSAGVMQMDKFADEVRSGVSQVTTINQMTYEIITEVQGLSDRFKLVNEGMRNQSIGAEQINEAMAQIADGARRSAQSVQEFERATAHLRGSVEGLNQEIAQFKI